MFRPTLVAGIAIFALSALLGSSSLAEAANCGANNQRPCKLWERVPSCNANLKEGFARGICVAVNCGKENGRPCTIVERIPSCDSGMVEDFLKNKCVKSEDAKRQEIAGRKLAEIAGFVASKLSFAQQVASDPSVRTALNTDRPESVSRAVNTSAVGPTQMPDGNILRTLGVGATVDAKFILGGSAIRVAQTSRRTCVSPSRSSIGIRP